MKAKDTITQGNPMHDLDFDQHVEKLDPEFIKKSGQKEEKNLKEVHCSNENNEVICDTILVDVDKVMDDY